ncbi:fumarylacetoacetate hydrolase family protein [soil metagenome]
MKLYKQQSGIIVDDQGKYYTIKEKEWDVFVNRDQLYSKIKQELQTLLQDENGADLLKEDFMTPIGNQEIWASGVTYYRSREARKEESKAAGGGDFYEKVYDAERPELFFKSTAARAVGNGEKVNIRKDSTWDVPEPELTLFISSQGSIEGYTIGNDMSSRSIEGENPLYLPQAKSYDRSAAIGPCLWVPEHAIDPEEEISLEILREGSVAFEGQIAINQIKRSFEELARFLFREMTFKYGCYLMTGTGIIPPNNFTLQSNDEIRITIGPIGTLVNYVN